jgi:hypothetical protein
MKSAIFCDNMDTLINMSCVLRTKEDKCKGKGKTKSGGMGTVGTRGAFSPPLPAPFPSIHAVFVFFCQQCWSPRMFPTC